MAGISLIDTLNDLIKESGNKEWKRQSSRILPTA